MDNILGSHDTTSKLQTKLELFLCVCRKLELGKYSDLKTLVTSAFGLSKIFHPCQLSMVKFKS